MQRKIVLVSHGPLAAGMKEAVRMVTGESENILAFGLQPGNHPDAITEDVRHIIASDTAETEYIIITDFLGGSMANSIAKLCEMDNVFIVSGMNISLVIELALGDISIPAEELIRTTIQRAKDSIMLLDKSEFESDAKKGKEDDLWS
jgi:fructoselysine and glucoselysine-specific PTS system IIA component